MNNIKTPVKEIVFSTYRFVFVIRKVTLYLNKLLLDLSLQSLEITPLNVTDEYFFLKIIKGHLEKFKFY